MAGRNLFQGDRERHDMTREARDRDTECRAGEITLTHSTKLRFRSGAEADKVFYVDQSEAGNSNQRTNLDGITLHSGSVRTYCIGSCVTTMCTAMRSHALEARRKVSFSTARMDNGKWHDMTRKTLTVIRGIPRNFDSEVALRLTKFF